MIHLNLDPRSPVSDVELDAESLEDVPLVLAHDAVRRLIERTESADEHRPFYLTRVVQEASLWAVRYSPDVKDQMVSSLKAQAEYIQKNF
jgi:hypothetical protein